MLESVHVMTALRKHGSTVYALMDNKRSARPRDPTPVSMACRKASDVVSRATTFLAGVLKSLRV
jgi:hypothetical protein